MNKKTLKALEESIEKWEKIVARTGIDERGDNCPLCDLFSLENCDGCPIEKHTGWGDCGETPYTKWATHHELVHGSGWLSNLEIKCKICERHAKAELKFLKSLLPKE